MTIPCPCYRCHERSAKCHGECPKYAEYRRELDELRPPSADIKTDGLERKIRNDLRKYQQNRSGRRTNYKGD